MTNRNNPDPPPDDSVDKIKEILHKELDKKKDD